MATAEEKAAAEKAAAEKAAADKAAADKVTAQAAEDKKNAERAAEEQKAAAEELAKVPVVVSGDAVLGGPFNIYGHSFGASKGVLTIGGREIPTARWDDTVIGGSLPPGTKGEVVLTTEKGVRHGTFPAPVKESPNVEVTVNVDGKPATVATSQPAK
jgi:colicin import membrane protein